MYLSPSRLLKPLALVVLLLSVLPAHAQVAVQTSDFYVNNTIYVHHKFGPAPLKIPVLLIHGTWGNSGTWDFPGRSVMDYLAVRGYDVYALDMRGMGRTVPAPSGPGDYLGIDIPGRVSDVEAVAQYIAEPAQTGRVPVVIGWSQGGLIAGLVAASDPLHHLVAGLGLLSVAAGGFVIPQNLLPPVSTEALRILFSDFPEAVPPTQDDLKEIIFGTDPITGKLTISLDALTTFSCTSACSVTPPLLQPDSTIAVLQETALCPVFLAGAFGHIPGLTTCPVQNVRWGSITVPALVVDGALDRLTGADAAETLFNAQTLFGDLASTNKQLIVFPRNSHGWFLEDNFDATDRVFDRFLSQFGD